MFNRTWIRGGSYGRLFVDDAIVFLDIHNLKVGVRSQLMSQAQFTRTFSDDESGLQSQMIGRKASGGRAQR
jgi:hypothetical protein